MLALTLLAAVLGATLTWTVLLAAGYWLVALAWPRVRLRGRPAAYVAVLGSGLEAGRMPDLLVRRMDTAIARWAALHARDPQVRLVLSGGQAPGQPRSEAAAMREYALAHGVPADAVVLEDRSRTTEENIAFTRDVVTRLLGPAAVGVLVTSGYHAVRAADLARSDRLLVRTASAPARGLPWRQVWLHEIGMVIGRHPVLHGILAAVACLVLPVAVVLDLARR